MRRIPSARLRHVVLVAAAVLLCGAAALRLSADPPADAAADQQQRERIWRQIAESFKPSAELADPLGDYRSPLRFYDGRPVRTAEDWAERRKEILARWHELMGPWPEVIREPKVEVLKSERRDNFMQHTVRFDLAPNHSTTGYLLVPDGQGRRPAVVVVYYEPETGIGLKGENRDFAYQLARRGFVALSIGIGASLYYPSREQAEIQPLSALAYGAANAYHVLAQREEVDPQRVGIVGHSYGGKWAMFASCLYERFACAAWSDGGIVFDERRSNVNYWEPWYLGYDGPEFRRRGVPGNDNPRTGAYKRMIAEGYDLHELHALMAPRPFLVSGGSEDPPARWQALNHTVAVNRLLGRNDRVAMTNRPGHDPTPESNEQMYLFFEWCLLHGGWK
jgi:pimeloyl-ACP methyl ester carboxylesterase